eukprot:4309216-Pleurochrysis_carterae.AAC.3
MSMIFAYFDCSRLCSRSLSFCLQSSTSWPGLSASSYPPARMTACPQGKPAAHCTYFSPANT